MWGKWFSVSLSDASLVLLSTLCVYSVIIFYTRVVGLRSFSKMSAADFAMTVAIGSLLGGSIVAPSPTVLMATIALAGLFGAQWAVAFLRTCHPAVSSVVDNSPTLLMVGSEIIDENLQSAKVTRQDLHAKLREANVWSYRQVLAVVFETTGDISVLRRASDKELTIEHAIFESVLSNERLKTL